MGNIKSFSERDKDEILKAYKLARVSHQKQKRDEGTPYIIHPLQMASNLIEELGVKDYEVICASLLHDVVEDTSLKLSEIKENFGPRVEKLIRNLTRDKKGETNNNKYDNKYKYFLKVMKMDKEAKQIKACDYLDNVRSWPFIPKNHPSTKKFERWFREAETMYLPLARSVNFDLTDKLNKALINAKRVVSR